MKQESMMKTFRDMSKNPDMHPVDWDERAEIKKMKEEDEIKEATNPKQEKKEKMLLSPASQAFKATVNLIGAAELLPEFKDNKSEAEIIKQRKKMILDYLERIIEDIKNYLSQVNTWQVQAGADYEDPRKYQEMLGHSDSLRRTYHNRLISDIKIANRLININFNAEYPEDLRLKEEAKMQERQGITPEKLGELMKQRQYFKFPYAGGAFIDLSNAPKDPELERKYFASWALNIYTDLTKLDEDLNTKVKDAK